MSAVMGETSDGVAQGGLLANGATGRSGGEGGRDKRREGNDLYE